MECIDFIIVQDGKNLAGDDIKILQFEDKTIRVIFSFDGTISGKLYATLKNLDTGEYIFQSVNGNTLFIGPNVTSYPGQWELSLIGITDFDGQETIIYSSNGFKNITVVKRKLESEKPKDIYEIDDFRKIYAQCLEVLADCYQILDDFDYKVQAMEASLTDVHNSYYDSLSRLYQDCMDKIKDIEKNLN